MNQSLVSAVAYWFLFMGYVASRGFWTEWKDMPENKGIKFLTKTKQKESALVQRNRFVLLSVQRNFRSLFSMGLLMYGGLMYPYLTNQLAQENKVSFIPGIGVAAAFGLVYPLVKQTMTSWSFFRLMRFHPAKTIIGLPSFIYVSSILWSYFTYGDIFQAKTSLRHCIPKELPGSNDHDELISEIVDKNDYLFERPSYLQPLSLAYWQGTKYQSRPGSENFWRECPKQAKSTEDKLKYLKWLNDEANNLMPDQNFNLFQTDAAEYYLAS